MKIEDIIKQAESKLEEARNDPAAFWEAEAYEQYDDMLDECSTCEACGRGGSSLKETDPTAYRCGFADYMDGDTADSFAKSQLEFQAIEEALEEVRDKQIDLETAMEELNDAINAI